LYVSYYTICLFSKTKMKHRSQFASDSLNYPQVTTKFINTAICKYMQRINNRGRIYCVEGKYDLRGDNIAYCTDRKIMIEVVQIYSIGKTL